MMIYSQGGQICQSKANWAKFNRTVKAGERKGIYVWMPIFKNEVINGKKEQTFLGCKLVGTWEVGQTEGDALEYDHNSDNELEISYDKVKGVMEALTDAKVIEAVTGKARGSSNGKDMKVSEWAKDTEQWKTMFHEVAHHILHTSDTKAKKVSYATGEVEAESVAYLVMSYLGMDFTLSKAYVNSYKAGIGEARTKKIVDTADKMIKALKKSMTVEEQFIVGLSNS